MAVAGNALAQEAQLPPLVVEGTKQAPKKKAVSAKKAPTQAPAVVSPAPQQQPAPTAAAVAPSDVPYTVPAGVSVVGQGEIATFGQGKVDNVLRTLPGTFTRESPGNPGVAVNIRGFEGQGRVNSMIDGVRQSFRFTGHEASGFTYVDPNLLAGIEVQRGAVSTAGGAGALAGTANFRTLGVEDILKPGQKQGVLTTGSWGSNGLGWSGMAAGAVTNGAVGIAGAISGRDQDNYKNGDGRTVPYTYQDPTSGLVKADFQLDEEQSLKFGGVFYDNDFLANSYFQHLTSNTFTVKYAFDPIGNDLVHLRVNGYRNDVTMHYGTDYDPLHWPPGPPGPHDPPEGVGAGRVIEDEGWGFDATNTSRFSIGAVKVVSSYGYEYFSDDVNSSNRLDPTQGGGPNPSGESSISSPFQQTTFSYGMFDLIAGLRYDMYALEGAGIAAAGSPGFPAGGAYTVDKDESRWSPKVTLAATPFSWLQPYVTYSESMRAPTINEALVGGIHPGTTDVTFAPNPSLNPEVQKGWELGFNLKQDNLLQRGDTFRFKADYFTMDVDNYIATCIAFSPPMTVFAQFCNAPGTSKVDGVELQGTYDAGYAFGAVGYTYTNTTIASQFNGFGAQGFLPDSILTLTGGLRFLDEKLTVGARGYIVSESYNGADQIQKMIDAKGLTMFVPNPNGNPKDPYNKPYELLDLFTSYKWSDTFDINATVTNVFDRSYSPALSTPVAGFTGDLGRGRTFIVSTRAQF